MSETETEAILELYHIPLNKLHLSETAEGAAEAAGKIGFPVALKISAEGVSHKSDLGGIILDLNGPE